MAAYSGEFHDNRKQLLLPNYKRSFARQWTPILIFILATNGSALSMECNADEFACKDGHCIMKGWTCDGEHDCHDKSDEAFELCGPHTCGEGQFSCGDGLPCIPVSWQCDTHEDCQNGSDEVDCDHTKCKEEEEFQCTEPKRCITTRWVCDQDQDCADGSDELHCSPKVCKADQFNCSNDRCIPLLWRCDGDNDCVDNSDEHSCNTSVTHKSCGSEDFQCVKSLECIHKAWECDGDNDCTDHSDESNCGAITCGPHSFQCHNGTCIESSLKCDGEVHCADGSDELDCVTGRRGCNFTTEFDCTGTGSLCIALDQLCDRIPHCLHSEDENITLCSQLNKFDPCAAPLNGSCSHKCIPTRLSHYCACNHGYQLASDNRTCQDINECLIVGTCSQMCENRPGTFKCTCKPGYQLDHKEHRCKAEGDEPSLLFANRHDLREIRLHTGLYQPLVDQLHSAIALDYDYDDQIIYWSDVAHESITRGPIRGGHQNQTEVLVTQNISTPDGLAIDWIHKNLYWTDTGNNRIEVMSVSDPLKPWRKVLVKTDLDEPRAIVLDPRPDQRYMYWTDWGDNPKIERANLDGSERTALLSREHGLVWPNGLAIDYEGDRLFWVDAKMHHIGSSNLIGEETKIVFTSFTFLKHPFAITVFEDDIYWSDWEAESILKVSKFHAERRSNAVKNIAVHLYSPMDVHIYHKLKQPSANNTCKTNPCAHLCFPSRRSATSFVCACSEYGDTTYRLAADNTTCLSLSTVTRPKTGPSTEITSRNKFRVPTTSTTPNTYMGRTTQLSSDGPTDNLTSKDQVMENDASLLKPGSQRMSNLLIACLIIGIIVTLLALLLAFCCAYRCYRNRRPKSGFNFDNPVYRRTTEDDFCIQPTTTFLQPKALSALLQPLTSQSSMSERI